MNEIVNCQSKHSQCKTIAIEFRRQDESNTFGPVSIFSTTICSNFNEEKKSSAKEDL